MSERLEGQGSADYELPFESEGFELKLEKAKEGTGSDKLAEQSQPPVAGADITPPVIPPSASVVPSGQDDGAITSASLPADSTPHDLEKQFVERAKQVISQTGDDPYRQKAEISKLKAEYQSIHLGRVSKIKEAA